MKKLMSLPLTSVTLGEYEDLTTACSALGLDGLEGVWGGDGFPVDRVAPALRVGYHLTFWPDWLDFWRGDEAALLRKFRTPQGWTGFYGGENGRETLLDAYRADLERAVAWGAEYVVFHVCDVSLEEGYTYRWEHRHEEVIDAAAEVINLLLDGRNWPFAFLMENQWWPGLTFTDAALVHRLLDQIHYSGKGLLLDTGHLMNANIDLTTQEEGVAYIHTMLDALGPLTSYIRAIHLHQSLSGPYVKSHAGRLPVGWAEEHDYLRKFGISYSHVLRVDQHLPFTCPAIATVVDRLAPDWLIHELSASNRLARERALRVQLNTLGMI